MDEFEPANPDFAREIENTVIAMPAARLIALKFLEIAPGYVKIEIPCRDELTFRRGQFQAMAIFAAADFAAAPAAATLLPAGWQFATIDCALRIIGPAAGERLIGHGRVLKRTRLLTVSAADVFVDRDRRPELATTALITTRNIEPVTARG